MAQHLVAWQESADQATLTRINAVQDDVLTLSGTERFIIQSGLDHIRWGFAGGINLSRAQVSAPSLLVRRMNVEILPRKRGTDDTPRLAQPEIWIPRRPIRLDVSENIEMQTAEDGAGATQQTALISLSPAELPPVPAGDILVARGTGTTTLVARAWTSVTITLDSDLPAGQYALVGFYPISAGVVAARAIIPQQVARPGVLGLPGTEAAAADFEAGLMAQIMGYNMGQFSNLQIPQFQFFSISADTAETVIMNLVKVG